MKKMKLSADNKMSLLLSAIAAVLLSLLLVLFCVILKHKNTDLVIKNAKARQVNAALGIDKMLNSVEVAIENHVWDVEQNLRNPSALMSITEQIVEANKMIFGSSVAFRPYFMPSRGQYYMVYSYRDSKGGIRQKDLGGETYMYFYMDWFQIPRLLKRNYWSEPFFDLGGGNMLMVTYSRPIYDRDGTFMGMITADISLKWLRKLVLSNSSNKQYYTFMLSRNGYYLVHPNPDRVMNETVFSATMDMQDSKVRLIGEHMLQGQTDCQRYLNGDTTSYIVFSGIPRTGWSLGTVYAENTFFEEFRRTTWMIFLIGVGSIIIQTFLIFWVVKRMYRKYLSASKQEN